MAVQSLQTVAEVAEATKVISTVVFTFGKEILSTVEATIQALEKDNGVKEILECKFAIKGVSEATELAYRFIDSIDDLIYYFQRPEFRTQVDKFNTDNPNLEPLKSTLIQTKNAISKARELSSQFKEKCNRVEEQCTKAAGVCSTKAREAKLKKHATRAIGGTAAGAAVVAGTATGIGLSIVAGVFTFGIGTVVGLGFTAAGAGVAGIGLGATSVVTSCYISSRFEDAQKNFQQIAGSFNNLAGYLFGLDEQVLQIETGLVHTERLVVDLEHYTHNYTEMSMAQAAFLRLYEVAGESYKQSSSIRSEIRSKKNELKQNLPTF